METKKVTVKNLLASKNLTPYWNSKIIETLTQQRYPIQIFQDDMKCVIDKRKFELETSRSWDYIQVDELKTIYKKTYLGRVQEKNQEHLGFFKCKVAALGNTLPGVFFVGDVDNYSGFIPLEAIAAVEKVKKTLEGHPLQEKIRWVVVDTTFKRFAEATPIEGDPMIGAIYDNQFYCTYRWLSQEEIEVVE